ncbi:MAG TPA: endonuclease/exonuclease/phosphatase family protein [Pilimelia sp.]|nr:endonuclease/exonuclease/phosphatase family protein [Pilimelia sp.]
MAGPELTVVSYNVHSQRDDLRALGETVRALAPDVLFVQEAPRRLRWRARCAALARRCGMFVAVGGLPALGNLVLVDLRVRVRGTRCVRFPLTPGRHLRGAAVAECVVRGRPFVAAGTHLSLAAAERADQARRLLAALADADHPVILGGDLNEEPGGAAHALLTARYADLAARAGDPRPTFPAARPDRRIDVLLADAAVGLTRYDVVDTPASRRASDHLPVRATVTLP